MKKSLLLTVICAFASVGAWADEDPVILPWGVQEPWQMKYVQDPPGGYDNPNPGVDGNGLTWTQPGYDDSSWETLTGPMANGTLDAPNGPRPILFPNYTWDDGVEHSFCLRRTFTLDTVNPDGYTFVAINDDWVTVHINGQEVCDDVFGNNVFPINASILHEGENLLTISFYAGAGFYNFLDYALFSGDYYTDYSVLESGDLWYNLNFSNNTAEVISPRYGSYSGEIVIPEIVDGKYTVTSIGGNAFNDSQIETITIPSSIKHIGSGAFGNCTNLEAVYITDLAAWCNIDFEGGDSETGGANPLGYAGKLYLNGSRITALDIPESVTEIKNYAFCGGKFTSLTIPYTLTSIGKFAFFRCRSLRTAEVSNAENGCRLRSIGESAFHDCYALESINFTKYVTEFCERAFQYCWGLTEIQLNDNLTHIPSGTFYECHKLTTINFPGNLKTIGDGAFQDCGELSGDLILPEGLTTIGNQAFGGCSNVEALSLPNTLTTVGDEAFRGMGKVRSLYIPSSVTSIGYKAFVQLTNAISIIVDEDNTKYDSRGYCNAIIETRTGKLLAGCQNTIIPEGTTSIEAAALCSLPNTFWIVPECVEEIKQDAFSEANINGDYWTFKTLVLGSGITDIGPYICNGGGFPLDVYCYATSVPITDGAAFNWGYTSPGPGMGTLHVPAESVEAYRTMSPWNNFTNVVALTGDEHFAEIDVVIGPSGYATFSYGYALDFTGIEGLTAYVAVGGKSMLTYQAVGKVPGGTGLLLAGEEGTYKVPVILSANAIPGNLLVGTVVRYSTTLADGDYLLQNDPADGIGFYQGAGKTLGAGKAYLHVDDASGVKSFSLPEDNATSIQGIEISQENNLGEANDNAVYNLAGQRVLKPGRGLYIMGGKKVVMK